MTEPEIIGSTAVFVNAGGESTSVCISAAIYYLIGNSEVLKRAREEVLSAFNSLEEITQQAVNLPYLNAIVEETLRIHPPTPGIFARRTKDQPELIDGCLVPPNVRLLSRCYMAFELT
jgi:cytochrome P450